MILLVGLGNPGPDYQRTLHNVGWLVLEELARRHAIPLTAERFSGRWASLSLEGKSVGLLIPHTFMNLSGRSVVACSRFLKIPPEQVLVIHDELDVARGELKLVTDRGTGGHRGVASIDEQLGTRDYWRLRVGIGRPPAGTDAAKYVLAPLRAAQWDEMTKCVAYAADAAEMFIRQDATAVMQQFHGTSCL